MATTKFSKRGVLERSRPVPAPLADTVTETRAELYRPDLSPTALNFPSAKVPVLPAGYETEQVVEDYTEAYFEYFEDDQLVSSKKSQSSSGRDTESDRFQSHVNPAFQHDGESCLENKGSSSEAVQPSKGVTTKVSQTEHETRRDADNKVHSKTKPSHARNQIPKATNKNQAKVLVDSKSGTSAPNLDKTVASIRGYNCQQDAMKSGDSQAAEVDFHIPVVDEINEEIIEVFVDDKKDTDFIVVGAASCGNNDSSSSTDRRECLDDVLVVDVTQKQSIGEGKAERPHSRSFSSVAAFISNSMGGQLAESGSNNVQRSKSMRLVVASVSDVLRVRKPLLRELSFSDCHSEMFRNYGSLRASGGLPKRRQLDFGDEDEDGKKHIPKFLKPELATSLLDLMQQLLGRGKVRQVAVLEQRNGCMLASLPTWHMAHRDEIGLVKAATINLETMFKISVEKEFYTCFKHCKDKIVCRSGETVLVAQTTNSCVVVGVASDNIPGSCLSEVSELARALLDKGW